MYVAKTNKPAPLESIHTCPKQRSGGSENLAVRYEPRAHDPLVVSIGGPHPNCCSPYLIDISRTLSSWTGAPPVRSNHDICNGPHRVGLRKYVQALELSAVSSTQPGKSGTSGFRAIAHHRQSDQYQCACCLTRAARPPSPPPRRVYVFIVRLRMEATEE